MYLPYCQKYWRSLNLEIKSNEILANLNLAPRYCIIIHVHCTYNVYMHGRNLGII